MRVNAANPAIEDVSTAQPQESTDDTNPMDPAATDYDVSSSASIGEAVDATSDEPIVTPRC